MSQPVEMKSSRGKNHFEGMKLTFKDVCYEVQSNTEKGKTVKLLHNVSAYFNPGQLSALMGPSGSGKTTLLDVLAGRKTQGDITGSILFGNFAPTSRFLRRYTGYVEQFDTLLETLTVREMLLYTAELKRPMTETYESKVTAVDALLQKLALDECQHVKIGSSLNRGISGGQAKRVNIGIALISNPRVLFLDEPTSGLDSYTANEVMTVVKNIAVDGTTICTTIHSPTPYAFNLFDTLMLLNRGKTIYYGPREAAVGYFSSLPNQPSLSEENSEAEWITNIVVSAGRQSKGNELADTYHSSPIKEAVETEISASEVEGKDLSTEEELNKLSSGRATVTPFWFALKILIKYRSKKNLTSSSFLVPRIASRIVFVFLLSTIFQGVGDKFTTDNFSNIAGALFVWCALPVFSAAAYLPNLMMERAVFYRERSDGLYRVITYLVGKMLDELVLAAASSVVFAAIIWAAIDFQGSFVVFWAIYLGNLITGIAIAYAIAAVAPNLDAANAMLPAYASTLIMFSGFMIRLDDIPNYYYWYTRINFVQYGLSALLVNAFDTDRAANLTLRIEQNGEPVDLPILEYYSLEDVSASAYAGIIYLFFVGFFIIAFVCMTRIKHQKR